MGEYEEARNSLSAALALAAKPSTRAVALALLAEITSQSTGDLVATKALLSEALPLARAGDEPRALGRVLYALGDMNWRLGRNEEARPFLEECLELANRTLDTTRILFAKNRLALIAVDQDEKERLLGEVLELARKVGNRERMMAALNHLGTVYDARKDYRAALDSIEQALCLAREIGAG